LSTVSRFGRLAGLDVWARELRLLRHSCGGDVFQVEADEILMSRRAVSY